MEGIYLFVKHIRIKELVYHQPDPFSFTHSLQYLLFFLPLAAISGQARSPS